MPLPASGTFLTLTATAFATGAHSRHKELARALLDAGLEVLWIGPSGRDVSDLEGLVHLPLVGRPLLAIPLLGRVAAYLASLVRHRRRLERVAAVFVLGDLELLAVRLFPPLRRRPVALLLRNDLVRKARARVEYGTSRSGRAANRLRAIVFRGLQRVLYPGASRLLVQTPAIARELRRRVGRRLPEPVVVPNDCRPTWTGAPFVDRRREWRTRPDQKLVGFVGNLAWEVKGLELLFDTFAALRERVDCRLVVVGGGADLDRVRRRAEEAPLGGAVEVVGPVPNASRLMANFDLMLVTSHYDDCPNVVLEALAAGVPLVATDVEAHAYLLGRDRVVAADPGALAQAAVRLLQDPGARRAALAAQEERRRRFDFDWGAALVERLREMVEGASPEPGRRSAP